jgi:hypothetical protein
MTSNSYEQKSLFWTKTGAVAAVVAVLVTIYQLLIPHIVKYIARDTGSNYASSNSKPASPANPDQNRGKFTAETTASGDKLINLQDRPNPISSVSNEANGSTGSSAIDLQRSSLSRNASATDVVNEDGETQLFAMAAHRPKDPPR